MKTEITTDMDFLCAKVRGLRGKMYAGPSLAALARLATSAAYFEKILSGKVPASSIEGQRSLISDFVAHLCHLGRFLSGARREAFDWLARRYQVENLKVLLRARARKIDEEAAREILFALPDEFALPAEEIIASKNLTELVRAVPIEPIADGISELAGFAEDEKFPFFLEAAVEKAYLAEGLRRMSELGRTERERCADLIGREILCHNVLFTWRARKTYSLEPLVIRRFVVRHGHFEQGSAFLGAFETDAIAEVLPALGMGKAVEHYRGAIATPADLEAALQSSLYRSARRLYTESISDFGVVVAYYYLKTFELQDLLRLSEAIRQGLGPEDSARHLVTVI
jgi:vacuolar-type H+-ATPase subunit C/Vma6